MSDDPIKNDSRDDSKDFMPDKDNWDFQSMPNPEDSMLANTSTIKDDTSRDINADEDVMDDLSPTKSK